MPNQPPTPAVAPAPIDPIFMPLRVPGSPFWPALRQQDEKKQRVEDLKKRLKQAEDDLAAMAKLEAAQETNPLPEGHAEKKTGVLEVKA